MDKIFAIAATSFQEVLRKKASYIIGLVAVLILASILSQMVFVRMAAEAGEAESVRQVQAGSVSELFGTWSFAVVMMAVFLGAAATSSEVKSRTIVIVLARPIERWAYLLGRWMGIIFYLFCFLALGIAAGFWLILYDRLSFAPLLWVGVIEMFVTAFFFCGVSLGFGAFMPPTLAGSCTLLLSFLPMIAKNWMEHPNPLLRVLAFAGYYIGPAHMPVDAISASFSREMLAPDYGLYAGVLLENVFYAVVVFAIGCVLFSHREPRLR